jgi:RNA polymerase sigma factor (sigma-70 family)
VVNTVVQSKKSPTNSPRLRLISRVGRPRRNSKVFRAELTVASAPLKSALSADGREALIVEYRTKAQKLGRSILRKWNCRLDLEEVDSLVDLSLCEAVQRYDASKGASFMTFLFYHLKGHLVRAVKSSIDVSAIPSSFAAMIDGEAADEDIRGLGLNAVDLADRLSGEEAQAPDETLWKKELSSCSLAACEKLDPLEREIIKRIFVHEQQIIDIAASLGYSRCHISRVKKKALSALHDELSVQMNQDDYAFIGGVGEDLVDVKNRAAERKVTHRRKPRAKSNRQVERAVLPSDAITAQAA